jgi:hypothetical protein
VATPPRTIQQLPKQRAEEIEELEQLLATSIDFLKLARIYAEDGAIATAGERLERARTAIAAALEQLNTFRAPAPPAKSRTPTPESS